MTRSPRAAVLGKLIATLALVVHASAWLHTSVAPHVTCIEHGEALHLGAGDVGASDVIPITPQFTATGAPAADVDSHDHCGLQHQARTSSGLVCPRAVALPETHAPQPRLAARPLSVPLLAVAPKTSPPPHTPV